MRSVVIACVLDFNNEKLLKLKFHLVSEIFVKEKKLKKMKIYLLSKLLVLQI